MQEANTLDAVETETTESIGEEVAAVETAPQPKKKRRRRRISKRKLHRGIFVFCMLAYPVFQFLVMWAFVNVDSILMTFQRYDNLEGWKFVGLDNYKSWIELFQKDPQYWQMIWNSVLHSLVGMFIIFPLCLIVSYFLCRKIPASGFFRIVFYLPSIIPLLVLVLGFTNMIKIDGLVGMIYRWFGSEEDPALLIAPKVHFTVYGFTIWAGIGGNLLLLSGAIKRVPSEVLESARLDGVGTMGELFRIIIPMIWPTLVTMFVMSMMGIFSVVFQPLFLTDRLMPETTTLGLFIFNSAGSKSDQAMAATLGIMCTIVVAPLVLLTRWGLDKMFANIDY